jgi:ubiquinone/menaquinone biosynthesis C-methylase UbiE
MPEAPEDWLEACPERLRAAVEGCASGEVPVNIAVMRMLVEASDAAELERALEACMVRLEHGPERAGALRHLRQALILLRNNPQAFATVRAVIDGVEHTGAEQSGAAAVAHWAAVFDRAARASPEGGVALYALGNPELLRDATAEVVARMRDWGLIGHGRTVLEIGCGIGRFQEALAPNVGLCVGIDISAEMIAEARGRCAGLSNIRFEQSSGRDLAPFEDASFDLVLAVDSFPYIVQAGIDLAATHVREAARVLRPGGSLLIFNFSYRGDPEQDRADVRRLAHDARLDVVRDAIRPFALWDGVAFELRKTSLEPELTASQPRQA